MSYIVINGSFSEKTEMTAVYMYSMKVHFTWVQTFLESLKF